MQWITCDSWTPGCTNSCTLHPTQASLSSTTLSHIPIAPLLIFVVFQSCVMLHGQPRDSAIRMSLCALGRYDILTQFLQYRARIDQHMWILELKGTSGLEEIPSGCTCAQPMPCYLQALQSPHCVLGLSIYPEFTHVLESCPRNVYNLAWSILQLHCWKNPPAGKSQPVPAQRLLSVAAGSAGAWPPLCRCLLTLCLHPSKGRSCRLWDCGCVHPTCITCSILWGEGRTQQMDNSFTHSMGILSSASQTHLGNSWPGTQSTQSRTKPNHISSVTLCKWPASAVVSLRSTEENNRTWPEKKLRKTEQCGLPNSHIYPDVQS